MQGGLLLEIPTSWCLPYYGLFICIFFRAQKSETPADWFPIFCLKVSDTIFLIWQVIHPSKDPRVKKYHDAKYCIFRELYEQQLSHRSLMAQALA